MTVAPAPDTPPSAYAVMGIKEAPAAALAAVIDLGDLHRSTMGQLPYAGFEEAAAADHIVVALASNDAGEQRVVGYCLYDPTKTAERYARIAHLCVATDHRGHGLAKQLVEAVRGRCADRLGLRLKCRRDWARPMTSGRHSASNLCAMSAGAARWGMTLRSGVAPIIARICSRSPSRLTSCWSRSIATSSAIFTVSTPAGAAGSLAQWRSWLQPRRSASLGPLR